MNVVKVLRVDKSGEAVVCKERRTALVQVHGNPLSLSQICSIRLDSSLGVLSAYFVKALS